MSGAISNMPMTSYLVSNPSVVRWSVFGSEPHMVGSGMGPAAYAFDSNLGIEAMHKRIALEFGSRSLRRMGDSVLAFKARGKNEVIQRVPGQGDRPILDFTQLANPDPSAKPVLIYRPGFKVRDISFWGLTEALGSLGYDIRIVGRPEEFANGLVDLSPDIVGLSVLEYYMGQLADAYSRVASLRPEAVTILGGSAAMPAAADFIDVVVPGEGDIALPVILKFLNAAIAEGRLAPLSSVSVGVKPKRLGPELARELKGLEARRILPSSDGGTIGFATVDVGSRIYVGGNGRSGFLNEKLEGPKAGWPIPIQSEELNALWRMPPAKDASSHSACLYVQRGCKANIEHRCMICSITSPAGRRLEAAEVLSTLVELKGRGVNYIVIGDEDFIQNPRWVGEFLDGIEREGIHRNTRMLVDTRADRWSPEILRRLWDLGIEVYAGMETMSPIRAERMGKVRPGMGVHYIAKGRMLMRLAAQYARERRASVEALISIGMICAVHGDELDDVLQDMLAQMSFIRELRERGYGVPSFSYFLRQLPFSMDRITRTLVGDELLARSAVRAPLEEGGGDGRIGEIEVGGVVMRFHPFYRMASGESVGMLQPHVFRHEPILERFLQGMSDRMFARHQNFVLSRPSAEVTLSAALQTLWNMWEDLVEYYGSSERADRLLHEFLELFESSFSGEELRGRRDARAALG